MAERKATNIKWQDSQVKRDEREKILGQRGCVAWLTGLPGSGKTTIAQHVEQKLIHRGVACYVLDGDNVRHGLNEDLGFSQEDRQENIRRISEVAKLFADAAVVTLTAFISPYRDDRFKARKIAPEGRFFEVFVDTPLDECKKRDPKGHYKKAEEGIIKNFTGVNAPYEPPDIPELRITTMGSTPEESADQVIAFLEEQGILPGAAASSGSTA